MPTVGIFRAPARHPFAHGGKRMQKRRQRPMVFGIPFVRLQSRRKKVPQRIACTSIPAAAPMHHTAVLCSPNIKNRRPKGPHLHLPPAAASARFDHRPNGRPAHPPPPYAGAAAIRGPQAIRCAAISAIRIFAWYTVTFPDAPNRAGSLETCGFKQRFWSLLGLRPKAARARKRGIVLSAAGRNGAAGGKKRDGRFEASVSFFFPLMPRNS